MSRPLWIGRLAFDYDPQAETDDDRPDDDELTDEEIAEAKADERISQAKDDFGTDWRRHV